MWENVRFGNDKLQLRLGHRLEVAQLIVVRDLLCRVELRCRRLTGHQLSSLEQERPRLPFAASRDG